MKGKISSISELMHDINPHMFLITETLLQTNGGINVKGFTFFGKTRPTSQGGGVGILVRNDIRNNITTHISERPIETIWISVKRHQSQPIFFGVYYGKQECRITKDQIETEFHYLTEEILEIKSQGEFLLTMDGNAKLGLLGEDLSRNGKLLAQLISENDLVLMNKNTKCQGRVTRQNTKRSDEQSAIDFVITSQDCATWLSQMIIDEKGEMKVRGKNPTDHNTIMIQLSIPKIDHKQVIKQTQWNLRASVNKWCDFAFQLEKRSVNANKIMLNPDVNFQERYKRWMKEYEKAAWASIGKTTTKRNSMALCSYKTQKLIHRKNEIKKKVYATRCSTTRTILFAQYLP